MIIRGSLIFLVSCLLIKAEDAFPLARRSGLQGNLWTNTGLQVIGGWPARTTIYTNFTSANTLNEINTGCANCPSNQVVKLAPGTYNLGGTLTLAKNGVTLRGATNAFGMPTVILTNCQIVLGSKTWPSANDFIGAVPIGVSSGYTEGSTSITLASSANSDFAVGDCFMMDQTSDGTSVKTSNATFAHRSGRPYAITLRATNISGATIKFEPPLLGSYWASGRTPQAFGWSSFAGPTYQLMGIEDLDQVEPGPESYNIIVARTHACWARNIRVTKWGISGGNTGIITIFSTFPEVFGCIFHDQTNEVSSSSYAIEPWAATMGKIENNIFTNLPLAMPWVNALGFSFSYNIRLGPFPYDPNTWLPEDFFPHGGHGHHVIYEGNWSDGNVYLDAITGGNNNSEIAIVRNRFIGHYSGKSGNTTPIQLEADMDNIIILGNILGEQGYHNTYASIWSIDASCQGTIRTNNYNVGDDAIPSSESIGSNTMLDSYVYASKPSWFGDRQWPAFSPTTVNTNVLYYTNIPAGFRVWAGSNVTSAAGGGEPPVIGNPNPFGIKQGSNIKMQGPLKIR